jgi:hypothetical protein
MTLAPFPGDLPRPAVSQDYNLAQTFDRANAPPPPRPTGLDLNDAGPQWAPRHRIPDARIDEALKLPIEDGLLGRQIDWKVKHGPELCGPCPKCGGTDRFAINTARGLWNCRECAKGGRDAVGLVMHLEGVGFIDAVRLLMGKARAERPGGAPNSSTLTRSDDALRTRNALDLWNSSISVRKSDLAMAYWASRGLEEPDDAACESLRFHPNCPFGQADEGEILTPRRPCILALFRNIVTDAPQAIHRIGLRPDGTKIDRMMLGTTAGAAVKLDPAATGLVIGEGIETVLAARQMGLRPAWAVGSAGSIAALPVLPSVATITLLEEIDGGASRRAVVTCGRRWVDAGRKARSIRPKFGKDMNDLVRVGKAQV